MSKDTQPIVIPNDWQAIKSELVDEILRRWEAARESGEDISPHDICPDCPEEILQEALRNIELLQLFNECFEAEPSGTAFDPDSFRASGYEAVEVIDQGGQGIIIRATDLALGREVVLKIPKVSGVGFYSAYARLSQESQLASRLEHPGVIPVYGCGRDATGMPFYAMRFVSNKHTFADSIDEVRTIRGTKEHGVAFQRLLRDFITICRTIEYAHSKQVIHRDIKPDNVLIGDFGEVFVTDFGIAKSLQLSSEESSTLGQSSQDEVTQNDSHTMGPMGTRGYMSPEQAMDASQVGPQSDIYSLGATLYHVLTGQPPELETDVNTSDNKGETVSQPNGGGKHAERVVDPPVSPKQVDSQVPKALNAVCLKAMATSPADRYATAGDLAKDIENWLADEPVSAWKEPMLTRVNRWIKRHRILVANTLVASVVAAIGLTLAYVLLQQANQQLAESNASLIESQDKLTKSMYLNTFIAAATNYRDRKVNWAKQKLAECHGELRGFEWHYLQQQCNAGQVIPNGLATVVRMTVSSDGEMLAQYGVPSGSSVLNNDAFRIKLINLTNGTVSKTLPALNPILERKQDPLRKALSEKFRLCELNPKLSLDEGMIVSAIPTLTSKKTEPDAWRMAFRRYQIESGQQQGNDVLGPKIRWENSRVILSPNGRLAWVAAAIREPGTAILCDTRTGNTACELLLPDAGIHDLIFSPDSSRVVTCGSNKVVRVWDSATGKKLFELTGHTSDVNCVTISEDNRTVAAAADDLSIRLWDLSRPKGNMELAVLLTPDSVYNIKFLPGNGGLLAAGEAGVSLWRKFLPEGVQFLPGMPGSVQRNVLATAKEHFALVHLEDGQPVVRVWDVKTRSLKQTFHPIAKGSLANVSVALSSDAALLAVSGGNEIRIFDRKTSQERHKIPGLVGPLVFTRDNQQLIAIRNRRSFADVLRDENLVEQIQPEKTRNTISNGLVAGDYDREWDNFGDRNLEIQLKENPEILKTIKAKAERQIAVVDPGTGKIQSYLEGDANQFAIDPQGRFLATLHTNKITIWNLSTFKPFKTLDGPVNGTAASFTFSPDLTRFAVGTGIKENNQGTNNVYLYNVSNWQVVETLRDHRKRVTCLAFSPDGKRLATGGYDRTVKLWETETWQLLWTFQEVQQEFHQLAFSASGEQLLATTGSGRLLHGQNTNFLIWDISNPATNK